MKTNLAKSPSAQDYYGDVAEELELIANTLFNRFGPNDAQGSRLKSFARNIRADLLPRARSK